MAYSEKKAPIWYEAADVRAWLKGDEHVDLVNFLAYHFQKAFEKGWERGFLAGQQSRPLVK